MKATLSLFPKFYRHLSLPGLAAVVRSVGLDAVNAVIRDGYWVGEGTLSSDLPAFVSAMRGEGLSVPFATSGLSAERLAADPAPLRTLAASGIRDVRIDYFRCAPGQDPRASWAEARGQLETLAPVCEAAGVRAVCQVHHGTLVTSGALAWRLVDGLPPAAIGVELDPGNQTFEGAENWRIAAGLLGPYLAAVGVKDSTVRRDPACAAEPGKGWQREWTPIDEGVVNWRDAILALDGAGFGGTMVFMPFYDEKDPAAMTVRLRREVAYLRRLIAGTGVAT